MKKLLLTFGIAIFGFTAVMAQDAGNTTSGNTATELSDQNQNRTSIDKGDLPNAVKDAVTTGRYENHKIKEAYSISMAQSGQTAGNISSNAYEIHLEDNDGKATVVTLNEQGQIIKSDESMR